MHHFCTYCDGGYVARAVVLYRSLKRCCSGAFQLHILCFDDVAAEAVERFCGEEVKVIRAARVEAWDPDLLATRSSRRRIEYYYTFSPILPLFILRTVPCAASVTYVDADLAFFSDPGPALARSARASVVLTPHHPDERPERTGRYNVGWLTFRADAAGLECLQWWREQCLAWCYERFEDGKYADQKYLDRVPSRFGNVEILRSAGVNLGPWNMGDYELRQYGSTLLVNGEPLVCFHFAGFREVATCLYRTGLGTRVPALVRRLYDWYFDEMNAVRRAGVPVQQKPRHGRGLTHVRALARAVVGLTRGAYVYRFSPRHDLRVPQLGAAQRSQGRLVTRSGREG